MHDRASPGMDPQEEKRPAGGMGRQTHVHLVLPEIIETLLLFFNVLGILGHLQCQRHR